MQGTFTIREMFPLSLWTWLFSPSFVVQLYLVWSSCILYDVSLVANVLTELSSFRLAILVVSFWELQRAAHTFRASFLFFMLLLHVEKIDLYDPLF